MDPDSTTNKYNFDLKELIDGFSFVDFVHYVQNGSTEYNGGFLVFTPKQYILGYNAEFGTGSHNRTFARVEKDLNGGGEIETYQDMLKLSTECRNKYFHARILYGKVSDEILGIHKFKGFIDFYVPDRISPRVLESFKRFYEDYDEEIKLVNRNTGLEFSVNYYKHGDSGFTSNSSLEELYIYLESIVDYDLVDEEDEEIVGIPNNRGLILEKKH